jgi:hypothetical protein
MPGRSAGDGICCYGPSSSSGGADTLGQSRIGPVAGHLFAQLLSGVLRIATSLARRSREPSVNHLRQFYTDMFLEGANFIVAVRWFGIGEKEQEEIADPDFVASG